MKKVCYNRSQLHRDFPQMKRLVYDGHAISWDLHKPPKTRSQRSVIHIMMRQIASHIGETEKGFKEFFKHNLKYWPTEEVTCLGKTIRVPIPTERLEREHASLIIEALFAIGAHQGIDWDGVQA